MLKTESYARLVESTNVMGKAVTFILIRYEFRMIRMTVLATGSTRECVS